MQPGGTPCCTGSISLLPREERFFDLFARHSEVVVAGAKALRAMLEGGDAVTLHCKTVMDREQDADNITREVLMAVRRSFITPFDRGDIKNLITAMDNAIDQMQKTAKTIMLFDQRVFTPQQREMGDAIVTARRPGAGGDAAALARSTPTPAASTPSPRRFRRSKATPTSCTTSACRSSTASISPATAMAFFIGAEIYDHLEKVVGPFRRRGERNPAASCSKTSNAWSRAEMDLVTLALPLLIALIAVALVFDFLNGLHDAANSIATIVSTRVLRPQNAVAWAAFFNFVAFLIFGAHVAQTVGTGIVSADIVDPRVVFGALMGAIVWNLITWGLGLPSSSSHALIGGLVGAGTAKVGISAIVWSGLAKTSAAIVLSPLTGLRAGDAAVPDRVVAVRALHALCGRPHVPLAATRVGVALFARPRRQRRAEDHGHHHGAAVLAGLSGRRVPRAALGDALVLRRDGAGHADRRLADRPHDGIAHHAAHAVPGLLRGDRRRHHAVRGDRARHSGLDHAHDHRLHHRRRRGAARLGGALERGEQHRRRLDHHDPGVGLHRRAVLRAGRPVRVISTFPELRDQFGWIFAAFTSCRVDIDLLA